MSRLELFCFAGSFLTLKRPNPQVGTGLPLAKPAENNIGLPVLLLPSSSTVSVVIQH